MKRVLDLLPSAHPRNPELVAQLTNAAPPAVATSSAATTLAKVPIEAEVRPRKIRISMHVTPERHYLVRRAAAELNMSVDAFVAEAVDAALRGLSLL